MNPLRHEFISSCLESQLSVSHQSKRRYLDVGCGGGIFAESAARLRHTENVIGIDPSNEVITVAREHARQDPLFLKTGLLKYYNHSIESMPLPHSIDSLFDVVSLFEVVEHINQPAPFLKSCLSFVKPGGWLILSTIARSWTSWLTTKLVAEEVIRMVPRGTHEWEKYVNEQELAATFRNQEGFGEKLTLHSQGCIYIPGFGWKFVNGGQKWGNYFFGLRKDTA